MLVIGAVLTLVLSFLVVIAVVVPRIKKRRKQKTVNKAPLSLPAPPTPRQKIKKEIDLIWMRGAKDWCEFYKNIGVKPPKRRFALQKYHPDTVKNGTEEEKLRASVIWDFINSYSEEESQCKTQKK